MLSILIVCYLFLGGAGGGACLILAVMGLLSLANEIALMRYPKWDACVCAISFLPGQKAHARGEDHYLDSDYPLSNNRLNKPSLSFAPSAPYRRMFMVGYTAGFLTLVLGVICLIVDLARFDRAYLLFTNPSLTYITTGAWFLVIGIVLVCFLMVLWGGTFKVPLIFVRVIQVISAFMMLGIMVYTGLLLQSMDAVPLWATVWLPALFVLSSLSCGIALLIVAFNVTDVSLVFCEAVRRLFAADAVVIVLEVIVLCLFIASSIQGYSLVDVIALPDISAMFTQSGSDAEMRVIVADNPTVAASLASVRELLFSDRAWVFWVVFILVGLCVPLVMEIVSLWNTIWQPGMTFGIACCVLIGGFAMRWCIVFAGMHPAVISASTALLG